MKFKTNHSPGQWVAAGGYHLISGNTEIAVFSKDDDWENEQGANISAITQVPAMLEYMMNRAKYLYSLTLNDVLRKPRPRPMDRDDEWEELDKILAILKDAGVEVVE